MIELNCLVEKIATLLQTIIDYANVSGIDLTLKNDRIITAGAYDFSIVGTGDFGFDGGLAKFSSNLHVGNLAEGGTGGLVIQTSREVHTLAAAATSDTTTNFSTCWSYASRYFMYC